MYAGGNPEGSWQRSNDLLDNDPQWRAVYEDEMRDMKLKYPNFRLLT
jgi:hypothetical protein